MNFIKPITLVTLLISVAIIYCGCDKETPAVATVSSDFSNAAQVQVFNGTVKSATRNYVYVDGTPVSGVTFSSGGVFPATAYAFNVRAGLRAFLIKDTLSTSTQAALSFGQTMEATKFYTIFMYDTITSPKQVTVTNNIVVPSDTSSRLRFANLIYNTTAVPNVDVYSYRRGTSAPVFTNIPTTGVTDFIPYASGLTDTLYVYATGTTSPLIVKTLVSSLTPQRSYTAAYNGSYRGTKTITTFATY